GLRDLMPADMDEAYLTEIRIQARALSSSSAIQRGQELPATAPGGIQKSSPGRRHQRQVILRHFGDRELNLTLLALALHCAGESELEGMKARTRDIDRVSLSAGSAVSATTVTELAGRNHDRLGRCAVQGRLSKLNPT